MFRGEAALHFRFRCNQIRQTFDSDEVHTPVLERTPGKLTCLGGTQTVQSCKPRQNSFYSCTTAVNLKFGCIFARKGRRARKE